MCYKEGELQHLPCKSGSACFWIVHPSTNDWEAGQQQNEAHNHAKALIYSSTMSQTLPGTLTAWKCLACFTSAQLFCASAPSALPMNNGKVPCRKVSTRYSWKQAVDQILAALPDLPQVLASGNAGHYSTTDNERQLPKG